MRCPKCQYITFDGGERCRNCGYDFSLAEAAPRPDDFPLRDQEQPLGPPIDLPLGGRRGSPEIPRADLPLFADADRPLIEAPSSPRPPLAVRRRTPAVAKARPSTPDRRVEAPSFDLQPGPAERSDVRGERSPGHPLPVASLTRRMLAGVIDTVLLGLVGVVVLYFTLRLTGLTPEQAANLPVVPFVAFLLLIGAGYFLGFTLAAGQTIGKMATQIRVVGAGDSRVSPRTACVRTAAYVLSLLPVGLGYIAAVADRDRRTFHDRLAATRVVQVI